MRALQEFLKLMQFYVGFIGIGVERLELRCRDDSFESPWNVYSTKRTTRVVIVHLKVCGVRTTAKSGKTSIFR